MTTTLFLIRGLPGSGKSTLATTFADVVFAADDYFMEDGVYKFDPKLLQHAHRWCQRMTRSAMLQPHRQRIAIANTFSQRWELEPYLRLARDHGVRVYVVDVFDGGLADEDLAARNVHGVTVETIRKMRERWEHDWRVGDTCPPWER